MKNNHDIGLVTVGVDIQNDFCPGGSLAVPNGDEIISPFNAVISQTRAQSGKIVFTRDWHPQNTSHFINWPVHCVQNTNGALFHPKLNIQPHDVIISKGMGADENAYSGFDGIDPNGSTLRGILESELEIHKSLVVQIGGLATDYCVRATVLDALAMKKDFGSRLAIVALRNCMRAVNVKPQDGEKAIAEMQKAGAIFTDYPGGL